MDSLSEIPFQVSTVIGIPAVEIMQTNPVGRDQKSSHLRGGSKQPSTRHASERFFSSLNNRRIHADNGLQSDAHLIVKVREDSSYSSFGT
jgi:hypothetical protein